MEHSGFSEKHYYQVLWNKVWEKASQQAEGKSLSKDGVLLELSVEIGISKPSLWRRSKGYVKPNAETEAAFLNYLGFKHFSEFKKQVDSERIVSEKTGKIRESVI